ncbi:PREDICTED: acyl-CoA-binding domain-containing protein 4 isoform X1 [Populus euphratica]|uniref:Acyl-CoA-binding domain-containing protein 4 isoform X1 n=3 Tax=Populus euphratica TaxID=75702 RepID=A0AAJ6XMT8_POPEU|nr:PREDICTED: acyl-CoA-binding domain-containing protein 4 isoform X1 [Populus euphratica]
MNFSNLEQFSMGTEEFKKEMDVANWFSQLPYEHWVPIPVSGTRPSARYKHAAGVADEKLYIAGGSRTGRYLPDVQVFDFRGSVWSSLKLKSEADGGKSEENGAQEVLPATSDHSMVKWGNKLLLLGGHSKTTSDSMIVRFIDLETHACGFIETSGNAPVARGGHSVTLVGSRLIIFGGEDRNRRLLNDVYALDLETMTWDMVVARQTAPAPRFDHTAAINREHYLLIFGGCSHSIFFNDLHVLDLQTMEWSQPEVQGDLVTPRAGHAGVIIGENWYVVGGGDNKNGCPETLVLNMSKLAWSALTSVKERDPLASEGLSVCSALINGERHLVAFGGYNGKYNNEVFVMRLKPSDASRPKIFQSPAAAAAAASVTSAYALAKSEKLDFSSLNLNSNGVGNNPSELDLAFEIDALKEEKKVLESSLTEVRAENSRLTEKVDEVNGTHAELSKELHSVQGQLAAERSRCFKLEAQIAELQKILESLQSIENEVQLLRRQKSALEQEIERSAAQRQGSGGVWRWIAG